MSTPFIGEVKVIAFSFPPKGWAFCNGQTMTIQQNQALFAVLGTTYGGDGQTTFALPNLQGSTPIHWTNKGGSPSVGLGQKGGEVSHTLTINEMPAHTHTPNGSSASPNSPGLGGNLLAANAGVYTQSTSNLTPLIGGTIGKNPGGQPHPNLQPYLVLNFIIALTGIYPPHS